MDVVFVRDGNDAVARLRLDEQVVGERCAERRDAAAAQVGERAIFLRVRGTDREYLAKLVVGNRHREARTPGGAVLDAAEADVEVTARGGRVDAREADLDEASGAPESLGQQLRDSHVETNHA